MLITRWRQLHKHRVSLIQTMLERTRFTPVTLR